MDVFKLLARSTKLKTGLALTSSAPKSARLPSTGKAENPQLFRKAEVDNMLADDATKGKKRKRGDNGTLGEVVEDDGSVLDFFKTRRKETDAPLGPKGRAAGSSELPAVGVRGGRGRDAARDQSSDSEADNDDEVDRDSTDEIERRTILNSHKVKVMDLRGLEEILPAEQAEKSKRRKNKQEAVSPVLLSKKEQKKARRLYPQPLRSFAEIRTKYKISRRLAGNIAEQGFTVPTEVQLASLPLLLNYAAALHDPNARQYSEPDILVVAPTGSGKTLSFLIPVINKIVNYHHHGHREERGILAIIVAPTRELASQIVNEGRKLVLGTGVKISLMKRGMRVVEHEDDGEDETSSLDEQEEDSSGSEDDHDDKSPEKDARRKTPLTKSDILVTTPLLLVNALSANGTMPLGTLPLVRSLVLDEADVLLDPLFREQTLQIWRACTHPDLRASLWSATMGSNIEDLIKSMIKERQESLGITQVSCPIIRLVVGLKDTAIPNIDHKLIYAATEQGKLLGLRQLLHPTSASSTDVRLRPPFIIFTQTIPRAVALHSELLYDIPAEAGGSSRIAVLHSGLSDNQRSEIMKGFRKGEIWILVTTDLLARGVDFRGVNGVVNYDIPNSAAVYVHRVGRTGRAGRGGGIAVTFYTKEDIPYVKSIANIIDVSEKSCGKTGEKSIQKWLLNSLPDMSKKDKKELKKHGVKARQSSLKTTGHEAEHRRMRISTKSGFDRKMMHKRKAAIAASRTRAIRSTEARDLDAGDVES